MSASARRLRRAQAVRIAHEACIAAGCTCPHDTEVKGRDVFVIHDDDCPVSRQPRHTVVIDPNGPAEPVMRLPQAPRRLRPHINFGDRP